VAPIFSNISIVVKVVFHAPNINYVEVCAIDATRSVSIQAQRDQLIGDSRYDFVSDFVDLLVVTNEFAKESTIIIRVKSVSYESFTNHL
jgi:hypothetical protein